MKKGFLSPEFIKLFCVELSAENEKVLLNRVSFERSTNPKICVLPCASFFLRKLGSDVWLRLDKIASLWTDNSLFFLVQLGSQNSCVQSCFFFSFFLQQGHAAVLIPTIFLIKIYKYMVNQQVFGILYSSFLIALIFLFRSNCCEMN
jgi:hypothetical protein